MFSKTEGGQLRLKENYFASRWLLSTLMGLYLLTQYWSPGSVSVQKEQTEYDDVCQ